MRLVLSAAKATTGHRMNDVTPVTGFVIDTPAFTYFLPAEDVYKACFAGEQNVDVLIRAEGGLGS